MTDDDEIRLGVICASLSSGSTSMQAWLDSEYILDRWRNSAPYAPPPKCVHGKLFTEECEDCNKPSPSELPTKEVALVGVEP